MNKRFSTLLAAVMVAGGFSFTASAQFSADRAAAAVTGTSFDKTTYYHLSTGNTGFTDNILSFTTASDGTDSLYVRTNATDGTWGSAGAAAVDSALWAIDSVAVGNLGYAYSFTNKVSGKKIALDVENEVVVLSDEAASFGWGGTIGGELTYVAGGKTYKINGDAAFIAEKPTTALKLYPYSAARVKLSANDLNAANGTYFQLAFDGAVEDNVFTNPNYKFEAVASDMGTAGAVYLRVKGAEGLKVGGNPKVKNDTLFVVVDTVKYDLTSTVWEAGAGFKLALDTVKAGAATDGSSLNTNGTPAKPCYNRVDESYKFTFYRNPGSATSDSLIVAIDGVKKTTQQSNGSFYVKGDGGYLSYASLNKSTKVLTTAADGKEDLPLISFKTGTKANLAEGAYFITIVKEATKTNKYEGKDAICDIKGAIAYVKDAASELMPSTQWSAKKDALGKYTFTNRDAVSGVTPAVTFASATNYLYTYGDNYIFGTDTIKLTPVTTTSKTVGYFNYTDEELANKAIALQFISPIGASAYVDINKDSTLYAAEMEESEAPKFKLVKAAEEKFGPDKLVRASYFLVEQFGLKRYLGLEGASQTAADGTTAGQFKMIMGEDGASTHYADTVAVVLRATAKEGEYQVIVATPTRVAGTDTYAASYTANQFQGTITGSKGLMQTVGLGTATLGTFKVVTPAAPEYLNIIDSKPSHQRLYSSANTTLAIGMGAKGEGMLKAVSELKADFAADDFKMYVDTACVEDATKPLFYILTTGGIADAQKEEGIANYLSVNGSKLAYVPASQYGLGNDTILYYNAKDFTKTPDSVNVNKSKSAFAFRATDTDGEFLIEAATSGKCLAQENGILYLVNPNEKEALAFCTEAVEAPTTNEAAPSVSEMTVIAGEGQVTIAGAAGKKVAVSNILGRTVANTVITSDNAVIAAPQGVVIVAVEGEETVKAIVK